VKLTTHLQLILKETFYTQVQCVVSCNVLRYPSTSFEGVQKTTGALNSTEGVSIENRTGHILNQTLEHSSSIWARRKEILVDNFFFLHQNDLVLHHYWLI
jgi:hypothetical protein